ncbi:MAG: helix-turn-helix domain-containing protein [Phycisphaerae bacterium]
MTLYDKYIARDDEMQRLYEEEGAVMDASLVVTRLMEEQGVSQKELAERLGTSRSSVSQLLNGSRNMTIRTMAKLLYELGHRLEVNSAPRSNDREGTKPVRVELWNTRETRRAYRQEMCEDRPGRLRRSGSSATKSQQLAG